ncbi:hypothetical protein FE784_37855 [Paenibacillus hemerocallicola]|jgi:hypothetical protein|uniref:DUF5325 family protein n=1 Tax=Paenibacillus hemerocallicola TaxID=1172614 RepID=A0A5C4SWA1_9BACL|nr:DUF5325 family protein [Paenibacillus hemerocallicola]TNJ58769.1 hypothetical protein FE784_37855 [Paenibacillus hemerocallicola]
MNRPLALLFAVIGTALLVGIAAAISYGNIAAVWLCSIGSVAFIGYGFTLKAKLRRKNDSSPEK